MDYIEPLPNDMEISSVFARFKESNQWRLFPIVNRHHEPLGVIREFDLKDFAYSRYGHELLQNPGIKKQTGLFIEPFPCVDIHTPAEKILELFAGRKNSEGIILVHNRRYAGFLGAAALLTVLNEKNLAAARDQNPLTRLPGNNRIGEYVSRALDDVDSGYYLVYFDFDNFKPYNDTYGFRRGDRVILLFAEMLRSNEIRREMFVGHIGGDDFFMGFHGTQFQVVDRITRRLIDDFKFHVEGFYDKEARGCGYIAAKDREGNLRQYGLLTVSAVILELSPGRRRMTPELAGEYLANLKKQAKQNPSGLVRSSVNDYAAQTSLFDTAG
jgi:GGDEF domain-containing protein